MAVVVDSNPGVDQTGLPTISGGNFVFNYTGLTISAGLTNSAAVFALAFSGNNPAIQSVTWAGINCTLIKDQFTTAGDCQLWGIVNPVSGNQTLVITTTNQDSTSVAGVSFSGVNQTGGTTSFANATSSTATSGTASVTVTSSGGNYAMAVYTVDSGTVTINSVNNTQVFIHNQFNASAEDGASNIVTGAASVTMSATLSASATWGSAGVSIVAAPIVQTSPPFGIIGSFDTEW